MILYKCFQENIENLKNASDKGDKNFVSLKIPNLTSPNVIINYNTNLTNSIAIGNSFNRYLSTIVQDI